MAKQKPINGQIVTKAILQKELAAFGARLEKKIEQKLERKLEEKLEEKLNAKLGVVVETLKAYTDATVARLDEKMQYHFTNLVQEIRRDYSKTKSTLDDHEQRISALESKTP